MTISEAELTQEHGLERCTFNFFLSYLTTAIELQTETTVPSSTPSPFENNAGGGDLSFTSIRLNFGTRRRKDPPPPLFTSISTQWRDEPSPTFVPHYFGPPPAFGM